MNDFDKHSVKGTLHTDDIGFIRDSLLDAIDYIDELEWERDKAARSAGIDLSELKEAYCDHVGLV